MKTFRIGFVPVSLLLVSLSTMTALAGDWNHEIVDDYQWTGFNASMALDSNNNPHITFYRVPPFPDSSMFHSLKYAFYDGDEWNISVVDEPKAGMYSSVVLDSSDRPHIVYRSREGSSIQVRYAHYDGDEWIIEVIEDDLYWESYGSSIALDSYSRPHIVYDNGSTGLWHSVRNGPSDWETCAIDTSGFCASRYPAMAIDLSDKVHVTYYYIPNELRYACLNGSIWEYSVIDEGGRSSITTDAFCVPHVSYASPDGLKYAKSSGTAWETEIVDSGVWLERNSIALDPSGNPVISYFMGQTEPSDEDLKFAFYDGNEWIKEMVYGNDNESAGRFNSIAVDSDGIPVIAFVYQGVKFGPTEASLYLSRRSGPTGISGEDISVSASSHPILHPVYPNPASGCMSIGFAVPEMSQVDLSIYDLTGHLILAPVRGEYSPGVHQLHLDGIAPGIYFCRMVAGEFTAAQRFVVIK